MLEDEKKVDTGDVQINGAVQEAESDDRTLNTKEASDMSRLRSIGNLVSNTLPQVDKSSTELIKALDNGSLNSQGLDEKDVSEGIYHNTEQARIDAENDFQKFTGEPLDIRQKTEDGSLTSFYKAVKNAGPLTVSGFRDMTNSLSRLLLSKDVFSDELPENFKPKTKSDKFVASIVPFIAGALLTDKALAASGITAAAGKAVGKIGSSFINNPRWTKRAGEVLSKATSAGIAEGIFGVPSEAVMDKFLDENPDYKRLFEKGMLTKEEIYGDKEFKQSDWDERMHTALMGAGFAAGHEAVVAPLFKSAMGFYRDIKARGVLEKGAAEAYGKAKESAELSIKSLKGARKTADEVKQIAGEAVKSVERLKNEGEAKAGLHSDEIRMLGKRIERITTKTNDMSDVGFKSVDLLQEQHAKLMDMLKDEGVKAMILDGHQQTIDNTFNALMHFNEANHQNTLLLSSSTGARVMGKKGQLSLTKFGKDLETYAKAIKEAIQKKIPHPDMPADVAEIAASQESNSELKSLLSTLEKRDIAGAGKKKVVQAVAKIAELDGDTDAFLKTLTAKTGIQKVSEALGTIYKACLISSPVTPMKAFMGNLAADGTTALANFNKGVLSSMSKVLPKAEKGPMTFSSRVEKEITDLTNNKYKIHRELRGMGVKKKALSRGEVATKDEVRMVAERNVLNEYKKNTQLILNEFDAGNPFKEAFVGASSRMSSIMNGLDLAGRGMKESTKDGMSYVQYLKSKAMASGSVVEGKYGAGSAYDKYISVNDLVEKSGDSALEFLKKAAGGLKECGRGIANFQIGTMEFMDNITRSQIESSIINRYAAQRAVSNSWKKLTLDEKKSQFFNNTEIKLLNFLTADTGDRVTMQSNNIGAVGELVKKARNALNKVPLLPIGDLLIPFTRTMSNSFMFIADHMPIASLLLKKNMDAVKAGGQAAANVYGKMAAGLELTVLGHYMHKAGFISAPFSATAKRRANISQGITDASFIVNTKDGEIAVPMSSWSGISFFTTLPAMLSDVIGSYKADELDEDVKNHAIAAMLHSSLAIGSEMFGELGLQRVGELVNSIVGLDARPESFKRLATSLHRFGVNVASGFMPAGVGYIARNLRSQDPDAYSYPATVMEAIRNKLGTGIPLYNMFGEVVKGKRTFLNGFLPIEYSNVERDPIMQEMVAIGLQLKAPSRLLKFGKYGTIKMNQEQYMDFVENYFEPMKLRKYVEASLRGGYASVARSPQALADLKRDISLTISRKTAEAQQIYIYRNPAIQSEFAERASTNALLNASAYGSSFRTP